MKDTPLLIYTRLKVPEPRKGYIIRADLFSKLEKIDEYKVVLIKGGAGTGKTTLVSSFIKQKNLNAKWISLDESCNNVFSFWNYILEALGDVLGRDKDEIKAIYDSNMQKDNLQMFLVAILNLLDINEDIYIVLEDFYYIKEKFLIETINFFIKNLSLNVHLIIITRESPDIYLGAISMEGRLLSIEDNELNLSRTLGISFLKDTLKLDFKEDILSYIYELSEGWIGGLQLIASSANIKSEKEIFKLNFKNRVIEEYINKEIYEFFSEEEKEFLLETSILSYFNEDICKRFIPKFDFKGILYSLVNRNTLISCVNEEFEIYRYHNILREYLEEKVDRDKKIKAHIRASSVFKDLGDYSEAINHLLLAGDYEEAMETILEHSRSLNLFSYIERIPKEFIIKNPDFAYQSFFYYYANLEVDKGSELYDLIIKNMHTSPILEAFKFSNMFIEDNFKLNEIEVMPLAEIDKLKLKDSTKAYLLLKEASFLYVQSKYNEALDFLEKIDNYSITKDNFYIQFFSFSVKSQVLEDMGEINKTFELYEGMKEMILTYKKLPMLTVSFYIGITGMYLKRMELEKAKISLDEAYKYMPNEAVTMNRGYRYNLCEYKFIIGETEEAIKILEELIKLESYKNYVFISPLLKYIYKFENETIKDFIGGYEKQQEERKSLDSKLLYGSILFKRGKKEEALELVNEVLRYSRKRKIKLKMVQGSLLKISIIIEDLEKNREVKNLFIEALHYSYENKILQPYFFEKDIVNRLTTEERFNIISELTNKEKLHYEEIINIVRTKDDIILSQREIDVLKEIAKGSTNKEIGENLFISISTVKTHIINIYGKLQVSNRVSAVEEGKRLKMI